MLKNIHCFQEIRTEVQFETWSPQLEMGIRPAEVHSSADLWFKVSKVATDSNFFVLKMSTKIVNRRKAVLQSC